MIYVRSRFNKHDTLNYFQTNKQTIETGETNEAGNRRDYLARHAYRPLIIIRDWPAGRRRLYIFCLSVRRYLQVYHPCFCE